MKTFARFDQRREHLERSAPRRRFHLPDDRGKTLFFDRQIAVGTELRAGFGKEQPKKMINFRDRRDGRFAAAARDALLDRDARRQSFNQVDIRFFQLLDELPRVGRHAVEKTALAFGEKQIEGERRFARAAQAGDDDHLVARDVERDVLEIVLARAVDRDRVVAAVRGSSGERRPLACSVRPLRRTVLRQRARLVRRRRLASDRSVVRVASGARASPAARAEIDRCARPRRFATSSGVPRATNCPPSSPAFRAEIDDPVGAFDHLEIVLDYDDRIPCVDQALKQPHEQRDIVEMQAGGRFVEDEEIAPFSSRGRRCRSSA